ncbi:hypothetical protein D3C87_2211010 [compost metagenome]
MAAQRGRGGVVEGPAIGPADRSAGGRNDDGFSHDEIPGLDRIDRAGRADRVDLAEPAYFS